MRDLVVLPPGGIRVRVTDLGGEPVPEFRVRLAGESAGEARGWVEDAASGGKAVGSLAPGEYRIRVEARGFAPAERRVEVRSGQVSEIVVSMSRGDATLDGVVVEEDGAPVPDAVVSFADGATGTTNAEGRFRLRGLDPRPGGLDVWVRGTETGLERTRWIESVTPGEAVRVVVPRGGRVIGRIGGGLGDWPLTLTLMSEGMTWSIPLPADDGSAAFEFAQAPAGAPLLLVVTPGDPEPPTVIEVPPLENGRTTDVGEVRLDPGRVVTGTVLDDRGAPLANARVLPLGRWMRVDSVRTDGNGRFRTARLPSAENRMRVDADGFPSQEFVVGPATRATDTVLRLARGGTWTGSVLSADGSPSPGAALWIDPPGALRYDAQRRRLTARANERGRWSVALAPGAYRVRALDRLGWAVSSTVAVEIRDGETTTTQIRLP